MPDNDTIPPLPKGYVAVSNDDGNIPPLPKGYVDLKKKSSLNGGGTGVSTLSNPFLNAKSPTGQISNEQVNQANQGVVASRNKSTEQTLASGTPFERDVIQSSVGQADKTEINKAAENTVNRLFKNNLPLLANLNKLKQDNSISLKNAPEKEDLYSLKGLKNTTPYQRKVSEVKQEYENGNLALTKFQNGEQAGEPVFTRSAKFLRGIGQGIEGGINQTKDAFVNYTSSDRELADYFDKQTANLPEIPTEAPAKGASNYLGTQLGGLVKPGAEFGIGTALTSETGGWGGLVALAADVVPSTTTAKTKELYLENMAALKEKYGDNIPDEERMNAIRLAKNQASVQAIPEEAMQMYLFGKGGKALDDVAKGGLDAFKNSLAKAGVDIPKTALLGGVQEAATQGISALQGNDVSFADASKKVQQSIVDWATMEAMFKVAHGILNVPKYIKSTAKEGITKLPPEIQQSLGQEAVAKGELTPEQLEANNQDLAEYQQIRATLPNDIPDDKAALVTGLLQRNKKLEASKKTVNPILHDDIDAEIKANEVKAKQILSSNAPLKHETDNLTGERGQDIGGRPTTEEKNAQETKEPIPQGNANVEPTILTPNESSTTEKGLGENIQQKERDGLTPEKEPKQNIQDVNTTTVKDENEIPITNKTENNASSIESPVEMGKQSSGTQSVGGTGSEGMGQGKRGAETTGTQEKGNVESTKEKDIGTKARDLAKDLREGKKNILPSWLKADLPEGTQKQGIDLNTAFANALDAFADIHDKTKDFAKAVEAGFKHLKDWFDENKVPYDEKDLRDKFSSEMGGKPPTETENESGIHTEHPKTILTHKGLQELSTEFGMEDITPRERQSRLGQLKEADNTITDWKDKGTYTKNINDVIERAKKGQINEVEQKILANHIATITDQLRSIGKDKGLDSKEYKDKFDELYDLREAGRVMRSSAGGLLGDKSIGIPDDTLEGYLAQERDLNNGAELTDNQIKTAANEHTKIEDATNEFKDKYEKLQADYAKLLAEREVKKQAANATKNPKKTHEDFIKERADIYSNIQEKLKKARSETNVTVVAYAKELFTIAADVDKIAKSLIEEGVTKLEDIVKNIHEQLKGHIPGIKEKDVHDILAGNYNERKLTKNEVAEKMQDLRIQAKLITQLEKLENGEEPTREKAKIVRNQALKDLRDKIKNHGLTKLADIKHRNELELAKIEEQLKSGVFEQPKKKTPLSQDEELKKNFPKAYKETLDTQTKLIKARQERQTRMAKQQFDNMSKREKFMKNAVRYLNVPRTLMASWDFSAPLRQGAVVTVAHPLMAARSFKTMFKHAFSQEAFDRYYHELKESPRWRLYEDSKLAITDPHDLHLSKQEENFLGGNVAERIPIIGGGVKASERAYVSYLNKMRIDLFNRYADIFEENGKTYSNSPDLYKGLATYINNATGRGSLGFADAAAPMLNSFLFSPRLIASRMNMLGIPDILTFGQKGFYTSLPKEVRVMAMKDMLKFTAAGIAFLAGAKSMGAQVEDDPRSSDFGKIRMGNTRWDLWGGFQPYVRVIAQLATGQRKTDKAGVYDIDKKFGQNRMDVLTSFGRGKLAPIPGAAWDMIGGRTIGGQKIEKRFDIPFYKADNPKGNDITFTDEAIQHLTPLIATDVYSAMKDQGIASLFTVGIPSTFGMGVQTYSPTPSKSNGSHPQHQQRQQRQERQR